MSEPRAEQAQLLCNSRDFAVERWATCVCDRSANQNIGYPSPIQDPTVTKVYVSRLTCLLIISIFFFVCRLMGRLTNILGPDSKLWKMMAKLINKQVN